MNLDEALKILNVDFSNSFKFVKKRYKELVNKYHPDISKENDCLKQIQLINYAYEICKNNQLRFMIDIGELENPFFSYFDYDDDEDEFTELFSTWVHASEEILRDVFNDYHTPLEKLLDAKYKEYLYDKTNNKYIKHSVNRNVELPFPIFFGLIKSYSNYMNFNK